LSAVSTNVMANRIIAQQPSVEMTQLVFERHIGSPVVVLDDLTLVENLVLASPEAKMKYLHTNFDGRLAKVLEASKGDSKEEWFVEAKRVLEILQQDTNEEQSLQNTPVLESGVHQTKPSPGQVVLSSSAFPLDMYQLLIRGYDVKVFTEDGSSRWMHVFVPKDMSDIRCKRLKENFIKPKWMMRVHQVRELKRGYDRSSPIYKSSEFFFRKLPKKEFCFTVFGDQPIDRVPNFHIMCDNSLIAKRLFEGLSHLVESYRTAAKRNLKRDD
jgi:hypothetical protein